MKSRLVVTAAIVLAFIAAPAFGQPAPQDVKITAPDGASLAATYYAAAKPGPGVILLHMCNSNRKAWNNLATMLAARGLHTLTIDYRGFGESGGKRVAEMSQQERQEAQAAWPDDIFAAFNYLSSQPGVDRERIGAGGGSCGVENTLQLARRRSEVKTVVLLAGGGSQPSAEYLAESAWMPVFASASRDDGQAVEALQWLVGFSSNPANVFKEYPNGGHGTEMFAVQKDLEPAIAAWFEQHLIKSPVKYSTKIGPGGPSAQLLAQMEGPGGPGQFLERIREARKAGRAAPTLPEGVVNAIGYQHLQAGRAAHAIALFEYNVETYPNSANVYDSLSDAYLAAKNTEKALEFARKALEALPRDTGTPPDFKQRIRESAETKLKQLEGGAPKM